MKVWMKQIFWPSLSSALAEAIKPTQSEMYCADHNFKEIPLCSKLSKINGITKLDSWAAAMNNG